MKTSSVKSSVTIKSDLFERLKKYDNKSKIINEALFIFFQRNDYLKKSEEKFWDELTEKEINNLKKIDKEETFDFNWLKNRVIWK